MLKALEFCLPTRSTIVRDGPDWLHEGQMMKERKPLYGGRIPDGYLPAHNHILHTPEFCHSENGALISTIFDVQSECAT